MLAIDTLTNTVIATVPIGRAAQAVNYVLEAAPAVTNAGNAAMTMAVATENPIRAGADAAMGYLPAGMIDLLKLLGGFLVGLSDHRRPAKRRWHSSASSCSC